MCVLVVTLSAALLLQGYAHHMFGITSDNVTGPRGRAEAVPGRVTHGGPVIADAAGTRTPPARRPAPSPSPSTTAPTPSGRRASWTCCAATMCRRPSSSSAPRSWTSPNWSAGSSPTAARSASTPSPVPDLSRLAPWQRSLELRETQLAVAGAAGVAAARCWPPYSSENDALNDADWSVLKQAGAAGYVTVLSTQDAEDWQRPGTDRIVANATPHGRAGQILLMHDGGGDRSQTVAALNTLIPRLKARGFQFATVGAAVGMAGPVQPAGLGEHLQGMALVTVLQAGDWAVRLLGVVSRPVISVLRAVVTVLAAGTGGCARGAGAGRGGRR